MDPEEDLDQGQSNRPSESEDNSGQQSPKGNSNPRSDSYQQKERGKGSSAKGETKGKNVAGKINSAADKLTEKAAEVVGQRFGGKAGGKVAKTAVKFVNKVEKKLAGDSEEARLAFRVARGFGPFLLPLGITVFIIFLIVFIMGDPAAGDPRPKLTITKSGPTEAQINEELPYQINVSYPAQAIDIVVTDRIPEGTEYIDSSPSAKFDPATKTATWNLKDHQASPGAILSDVNITLAIRLRAIADSLLLVNQAEGTVTPFTPPGGGGGGPVTGDIAKLLPNPLPPDVEGTQGEKTAALDAISANRAVYEKVAAATGVPWQVFAGIHYREGGAGPTKSIVSGREIGANEPDVVDGPGCSASAPIGVEDGKPEVSGNQCVFSSLADSGIYSGTLLKQKVDGNLNTFEDLVKAMSYYNGGGNSNCDKTPYTGCPRQFIGEDDTYVMNLFDNSHVPMYIVYCADYTKCNPPVEDGRPGTATVTKWAAQSAK